MSNQPDEPMFSSDNPKTPLPADDAVAYGYPPAPPTMPQPMYPAFTPYAPYGYLPPPPLPRNRNRTVTWLVVFFLFICIVGFFVVPGLLVAGLFNFDTINQTKTESLRIETQRVVLEIDNPRGDVKVETRQGAESIEVTFKAEGIQFFGSESDIDELDYTLERRNDRYIVDIADYGVSFSYYNVDVVVVVPPSVDVLEINGVTGNVTITDLTVKNNISIGVTTGDIEYDGVIGPTGSHSMQTQSGNIKIIPRAGSGFDLNATVNSGGSISDNLTQGNSTISFQSGAAAGSYNPPPTNSPSGYGYSGSYVPAWVGTGTYNYNAATTPSAVLTLYANYGSISLIN